MTHPLQLHATAALWSLHAATRYLAEHRETVLIKRPQLGPAAFRPRSLAQLQAHGALLRDERPDRQLLAGVKVLAGPAPISPGLLDLEQDIRAVLGDVDQLLGRAAYPPVWWRFPRLWQIACGPAWRTELLAAAVADTAPGIAAEVTALLAPVDARVRAITGHGPDHWMLPLAPPCPVCRERRIRVQTSAPDSTRWTAVCLTATCLCIGDGDLGGGGGCPCGMPTRAAGVRHIWDVASPLVASALAGVALVERQAA